MTASDILAEIKPLGLESYKKVMFNHGAKEPFYGVKIEDLKKIQKRIKSDYQLALDLYDTGIGDAMYLAGLIADDAKMTQKDLQRWVAKAYCRPLAGWVVATVAAGSPQGWETALEWIDSDRGLTAAAGWSTLTHIVSVKPDAELDFEELKALGWTDRTPRLVAAEVSGSITAAMASGEPMPPDRPRNAATIATSIGASQGTVQALEVLRRSGGAAITIEDDEISRWVLALGAREGIWPEPASAAPFAAIERLRAAGTIESDARVVALLTASGLKDTGVVEHALPPAPVVTGDLGDVMKALRQSYGFSHG